MAHTFVIGDIHGAYNALMQCLERAEFNYESDHLICLGDVCDGWPDTKRCIDEMLKIKLLTYILGNHDLWTLRWMKTGIEEEIWRSQGGAATISSYAGGVPDSHIIFLEKACPYLLLGNRLFVHAGIDPEQPLERQDLSTFAWDRTLIQKAWTFLQNNGNHKLTKFDEVYVGHTPIPSPKPLRACEIWMMDTGAGWSGVLSIMNIDTKEIFTSEKVSSLYPGIEGRMKNK